MSKTPPNPITPITQLTQLTAANLTNSKTNVANIAELFAACGQRIKVSDLLECLSTPGTYAVGVSHCRRLVGAAIYQVTDRCVNLLDVVVHRDCRRQGIGRKMLDKISAQTVGHGRLDLIVSLPSPGGSLARFLIACKFRPAGNCATERAGLRFFFRRSVADDVLHSIWYGDGRTV